MTKLSSLLAIVLDRSGSMESIRADTIGGFNAFLEEQKRVEGECWVTLAQFDNVYELLYHRVPLTQVPELTRETFVPRGGTALLDAMGRTLNTVEQDLAELERQGKRPDKTYFIVITDGGENSSVEFKREQVFQMIDERRKNSSWEFIFLAANQDAITAGQSYGFAAGSSIDYNSGSTSQAYNVISGSVSGSRATGSGVSFTQQQRNAASGNPGLTF